MSLQVKGPEGLTLSEIEGENSQCDKYSRGYYYNKGGF